MLELTRAEHKAFKPEESKKTMKELLWSRRA